jgi:hypothetical protein
VVCGAGAGAGVAVRYVAAEVMSWGVLWALGGVDWRGGREVRLCG